MDTMLWIAVAIVVLVVVAIAVGAVLQQRRRRNELRQQFGPEYERTVRDRGEREAQAELAARTERVEELHIRPLPAERRSEYADKWRSVQARFVDDPEQAIGEADRLVEEVMQARGYPMVDFEQRAADISVEHAGAVENYRAAHAIARRVSERDASTEDMRQAMVHYRTLFDDLIETREVERMEARR